MTGAELLLALLVVAGVGVLVWAVATRLVGAARWIEAQYEVGDHHVTWPTVASMTCDGPCARLMPHECDGVLARCIECGALRITPEGRRVL